MRSLPFLILVISLSLFAVPASAGPWEFGFATSDITPQEPVRLTGHPARDEVSSGISDELLVRVMALRIDGKVAVIASIDAFGLPGVWTVAVNQRIEEKFGIPRSRVVLAATGTHSAPQLIGGPVNLLRQPLAASQTKAAEQYTEQVATTLLATIEKAVARLEPGTLAIAKPPGVPPVLVIREGKSIRGLLFQATEPNNRMPPTATTISSDWLGAAQRELEAQFPGLTALAMIGTIPHPPEEVTRSDEAVREAGKAAAKKIAETLAGPLREIESPPTFSFGYAGLAPIRPDASELSRRLLDKDIHVRRHAAAMLKVFSRMGRLPESYPCPIHVWRFGDELAMVFSGGLVVSDYRDKLASVQETPTALDSKALWLSSLADDAFGYVTAKSTPIDATIESTARYFELPGPWEESAEEVVLNRIRELWEKPVAEEALSPTEALATFRLTPGFEIELVASEPLIRDPINFAFGTDGRLWVVEMGDYPRGTDGKGKAGGRIVVLVDRDQDGKFEEGQTFLDDLDFPTGVMPWRKGALICGAPEIFYAEDADGDGNADTREVLYEGFTKRNPQHRANGFSYGLDGWIYVAANSDGEVRSTKTGKVLNLSGRDCRIRPETGAIEAVNGHSQYIRDRDDFGQWFGNENWCPIWHYLFPDRYSSRNPYIPGPKPWVPMQEEFRYPPVYPASRTVDRFNDLFTANRFTSACSPTLYRDQLLWPSGPQMALVCEPVHNLVHRLVLQRDGLEFPAERAPEEQSSEFVASTDTWSRPTRVTTGPDGAIWIADMYRHVIEHPEWIPEVWQARLDVRAGADKGRIYRVYPTGKRPGPLPKLSSAAPSELIAALESPNGPVRDMAQRQLIELKDPATHAPLTKLAKNAALPQSRIAALCTLSELAAASETVLVTAMADSDPQVRRWGIELAEPILREPGAQVSEELVASIHRLAGDADLRVRFQLALSLGEWNDPQAGQLLGSLVVRDFQNPWIRAAVLSSSSQVPENVLAKVLAEVEIGDDRDEVVKQLIATTIGRHSQAGLARILNVIVPPLEAPIEPWHLVALAGMADAIQRDKLDLLAVARDAKPHSLLPQIQRLVEAGRAQISDESLEPARRIAAVALLGRMPNVEEDDWETFAELLKPQTSPELRVAVVETLARRSDAQTAETLLAGWRGYVPALRGQVLDVLLSRPEWTAHLLKALEQGDLPVEQLDASRRERLLGLKDPALKQRATAILAKSPPASRRSVVESHRQALELAGNPLRGAAHFQKTCSSCHELRGRGTPIGANLAILQDKSSPALLEAILDPNKAVEAKFVNYSVATTDGRVLSGLVVAETASSITLATADGKQEVILRVDLEELTGTGKSFMPEGLEKDLSLQDLADLFAFIQSGPTERGTRTTEAESVARQQWRDAGGNQGFAKILRGPAAEPIHCWLGDAHYFDSRHGQDLRWETGPAPQNLEPSEKYHFRIPVIIGGLDQPATTFEMHLAGQTIAFAPTGTDASWKSPDGSATLSFLLMESGEGEVSGVLDLEVPGSQLSAGAPLSITLKGAPKGCWLGLISLD